MVTSDLINKRFKPLFCMHRNKGTVDRVAGLLNRLYSKDIRHYHNLGHIQQCLSVYDSFTEYYAKSVYIEYAIWFHDIVYDPKSDINEENSAFIWSLLAVGDRLSLEEIVKVSDLILITKHDTEPKESDEKLIVDIDLSILGSPKEIFSEYGENIRKEYQHVNDEDYRIGRTKVLESFLNRGSIYYTDFFKKNYEKKARLNLTEAIEKLK